MQEAGVHATLLCGSHGREALAVLVQYAPYGLLCDELTHTGKPTGEASVGPKSHARRAWVPTERSYDVDTRTRLN